MSEDAIHNPSPELTAELTEDTRQSRTGNSTLTENTVEIRQESHCVENNENTPVPDTTGSPMENTASYQSSYQANQPSAYQANHPPARRAPGRPTLKMSKEQLMAAIGEVTEKLGHVPSHAELMRSGKVSGRQIVKHFGTYTRALRACNLERSTGGHKVPLEKLFLDWARVVREIKKIPSKSEYETMGKHSITPLRARFGSWGQVPRYLRRYMEEQGLTEEWKDVMELIRAYEQGLDGMEMTPTPECEQKKPRLMTDRPVYGPLMRPYPMIHGPINESGVLYLFGTVSERLGFVVTLIQTGFPDCLAMRLVDVDRWQPVRIELEYESRNFLRHLHDPSQCDIIVCWRHNWMECPLEVIELSKIVAESSN